MVSRRTDRSEKQSRRDHHSLGRFQDRAEDPDFPMTIPRRRLSTVRNHGNRGRQVLPALGALDCKRGDGFHARGTLAYLHRRSRDRCRGDRKDRLALRAPRSPTPKLVWDLKGGPARTRHQDRHRPFLNSRTDFVRVNADPGESFHRGSPRLGNSHFSGSETRFSGHEVLESRIE